jgi:hypothetical protein
MTIDDPIEVHLQEIKGNVDANITRDLSGATVAGALSLIPGVGAAIQSLLDGRAKASFVLLTDLHSNKPHLTACFPD